MGDKVQAELFFNTPFKGTGKTENNASVSIGREEGEAKPYELLLMALGSCLYVTFEDIAEKKKITYESVSIKINGEKQDDIPATLKECFIELSVKGVSTEKGLQRTFDLACKYCSIYQTLSHVAEMKGELKIL